MILGANNQTRKLQSVTVIGAGDGSLESGAQIMMGFITVGMAIENPNMASSEREKMLQDLGFLSGGSIPSKLNVVRNSISYSLSTSNSIGIWFTVAPAN